MSKGPAPSKNEIWAKFDFSISLFVFHDYPHSQTNTYFWCSLFPSIPDFHAALDLESWSYLPALPPSGNQEVQIKIHLSVAIHWTGEQGTGFLRETGLPLSSWWLLFLPCLSADILRLPASLFPPNETNYSVLLPSPRLSHPSIAALSVPPPVSPKAPVCVWTLRSLDFNVVESHNFYEHMLPSRPFSCLKRKPASSLPLLHSNRAGQLKGIMGAPGKSLMSESWCLDRVGTGLKQNPWRKFWNFNELKCTGDSRGTKKAIKHPTLAGIEEVLL